jgi:hypothetical protein
LADEALVLVAQVYDQFSAPIRRMQTQLRALTAENAKSHAQGMQLAKGHADSFTKLRESATKTADTFRREFTPVFKEFAETATGLRFSLTGIGGAAAAAVGGASAMAFSFAGTARSLRDLSQSTGMSVNDLRVFEQIGPRIGSSVEAMDGGFQSLNAHMERLRRNPTAEIADMAATMFPNVRNQVAQLAGLSRPEQFERLLDIAQRIKETPGRGGGEPNERRFLQFFGLPPELAEYSGKIRDVVAQIRQNLKPLSADQIMMGLEASVAWSNMQLRMKGFSDYVGATFAPVLTRAMDGIAAEFTTLESTATGWFAKLTADPSVARSWHDLSTRVGSDIKSIISSLSSFDDTATRPRVLPLSVAPQWVGFGQDIKNLITDADNVVRIVDDLNAKKINWAEILNLADLTGRIASFETKWRPVVDWSDRMARQKWWLPGNQSEPPPSKDQPEGPTGPSVLDRLRSWFGGRSTGGPGRSPSGPTSAPLVLPNLGGMDQFSKPATAPSLPQFAPGYSPIAFRPADGGENPLLDKGASGSSSGTSGAIAVIAAGVRKGGFDALTDFYQSMKGLGRNGGGITAAAYETGAGGPGGVAGGLGGGLGGTGSGGRGAGAGGPAGELGGALRRHGQGGGGATGGAGDNPYRYDASKAPPGSLTKLIGDAAESASKQPGAKLSADQIRREMEGIRAGESGHGPKYDFNPGTPGHPELSYGPFQFNRRAGFGVQFEKDTAAERKRLGLGDLTDPRTMQMQTDYLAKYLARGGSTAPWMGFHGSREADPRWGNSGLVPYKANIATASMPSRPVTPTPPVKGSLQAWEALRKTLATGKWGTPEGKRSVEPYQGDPTDPAFDKNKWLPYSKTPWSPGLHWIDPHKEQQASLQRREPGSLLRASNQMQAAALKHTVSGEASLKVSLASGLKPVGGVSTKGSLFKEIRMDRAPLPLASTTG